MPTTVTAEKLAKRIKGAGGVVDDDITHAYNVAVAMVDEATAQAFRLVPVAVVDECVLSVGYAVYDRKKSSHGGGQLTTVEAGAPVRQSRDPKASIRTILADYILGTA